MKKILLLTLITVFNFIRVAAQKDAENKVLTDCCDCLNKIETKNIKAAEAKSAMTKCIAVGFGNNYAELTKAGVDLSDSKKGEAYGKKLGEKLVTACPKFVELSIIVETAKTETENEEKTIEGTFLRVEKEGIAKIFFKDENGKEVPFVWLTNFPNSEQFMGKAIVAKDKKFTITWTEIEIYIPKADGYYTVKQILGIE